jgi:hypothetical protein
MNCDDGELRSHLVESSSNLAAIWQHLAEFESHLAASNNYLMESSTDISKN